VGDASNSSNHTQYPCSRSSSSCYDTSPIKRGGEDAGAAGLRMAMHCVHTYCSCATLSHMTPGAVSHAHSLQPSGISGTGRRERHGPSCIVTLLCGRLPPREAQRPPLRMLACLLCHKPSRSTSASTHSLAYVCLLRFACWLAALLQVPPHPWHLHAAAAGGLEACGQSCARQEGCVLLPVVALRPRLSPG
jgi:hypothetical protein